MTEAVATQAENPAEGHRKVKILLVDDNPESLVSLEAALEALNQEVVLARSGKEALRHCLNTEFAAILLDVKMPDMDGFETAELIRSRPNSRDTPILFLTGYKNEEHLFRGYDLGAVDFLFKPIVPEILRSKAAVFIELSRKAELLQQQATALAQQAVVLKKAEQRFRSLLEAAPDSMVICRDDGQIVLVNSRTESLFRYSRDELLGRGIRMLVPEWTYSPEPSDDEDPDQMLPPFKQELPAIRRGGMEFPVEISSRPLQTDEGLWITSAIRDITDRKRAEQERHRAQEQVRQLNVHLEELNAHLEERVIERTEDLARSNEELAQFAYVASHDLQEPLRTVSIYSELLAKRHGGVLDQDAQQYLRFVLTNAKRMEQLIRDLLDFSQLDGRGKDHFTLTECDAALNEALENLQDRISQSRAAITSDPLPRVLGDSVQLVRLFQNLVVNSIKYKKPGVAPRVHVGVQIEPGEYVFSVQDNGMGIAPQYTEKIFGIFKRLHDSDTPGTGMGLAICKKIVARHAGRIWVESDLGKGANFRFTLPRHPFVTK